MAINKQVFTNLKMKSSTIILHQDSIFPVNPGIGTLAFKDGVLYIWASIDGLTTWYPLTNKNQHHIHSQGIKSNSWTITHNLRTQDLIYFIYNEDNTIAFANNIQFINDNEFILYFSESVKGKVVVFGASEHFAPAYRSNIIEVGSIVLQDSSITVGGIDIVEKIDNINNKLDSMFDWDVSNQDIIFKADLIPSSNELFSIGRFDRKIKDFYISANTIHVGDNTKFEGTNVLIDAGINPTNISETPTLVASAIYAKPFKYNPGSGDITVRPTIGFQDTDGSTYPISFDTVNNKFSFDAQGNYGQGTIVCKNLEASGDISSNNFTVNNDLTISQDFRVDGNTTLGYDNNNTITIRGVVNLQTPIIFSQSATLGDGNDNITINCGLSNNLTATAGNFILDATKLTVPNLETAGNLTVNGNLYINGSTTSVNTTDLNITDNLIVLNKDEQGPGVSAGASGIRIDRGSQPDALLLFDEATDKWKVGLDGQGYVDILTGSANFDTDYYKRTMTSTPSENNTFDLGSSAYKFKNIYSTTFTGDLTGNSSTATKLSTARNINLTGDVTGGVYFDGSADVSISVSIADDSHLHDADYYNKTLSDVRFLRRDTHAVPSTDNSFNLGDVSNKWANVYANRFVGNVDSADKWKNSRRLVLSGDASGFVDFDGSADVTLTVTIADDSHNHVISNIDGLDTLISSKSDSTHTHDGIYLKSNDNALPSLDNTYDLGSSIRKFKDVYANSFIGKSTDSDKLDGLNSIQFLRSDADNTYSNKLILTNNSPILFNTEGCLSINDSTGVLQLKSGVDIYDRYTGNIAASKINLTNDTDGSVIISSAPVGVTGETAVWKNYIFNSNGKLTVPNKVSTPSYDFGDGTPSITESSNEHIRITNSYGYLDLGPNDTDWANIYTNKSKFYINTPTHVDTELRIYNTNTYLNANEGKINNNTIWHSGNDGVGSGLNADLLDGYDSNDFLFSNSLINPTSIRIYNENPFISFIDSVNSIYSYKLIAEENSFKINKISSSGEAWINTPFVLDENNNFYFNGCVRVKENNPTIIFEDTDFGSGAGSKWWLQANSGKFSIDLDTNGDGNHDKTAMQVLSDGQPFFPQGIKSSGAILTNNGPSLVFFDDDYAAPVSMWAIHVNDGKMHFALDRNNDHNILSDAEDLPYAMIIDHTGKVQINDLEVLNSSQVKFAADLAEVLTTSDNNLPVGTVVMVPSSNSNNEIEICDVENCISVVGVISENPAYLMNSASTGLPVAYTGKVKIRVHGPVKKGMPLVSSNIPGVARMINNIEETIYKFAISLEDNDNVGEKIVMAIVK